MKKFLIVNPFGIGDVLFTTPVIRAIRESEPVSVIGYWCNERVRGILENNSNINKIFALSRGDLKKIYRKSLLQGVSSFISLFSRIKKEKFDTLLDFSLDHRYSLMAKLIGIKKRVGFDYKGRGRFLTDKIAIEGYSNKHVVEYYLDLLRLIGIKPTSFGLELAVPEENKKKCKAILAECGINDKDLIIGIAPGGGGSWGKDAHLKHWPALSFAELADKIIERFGAKIVILGDESERPIADIVIMGMRNKPVDLTGRLGLGELCAVINELRILIANDAGPLHMAVALGRKTLSFFGPVDPKVYGPYPAVGTRHIVLKKDLECAPCYINFHLTGCKKGRECLEKINIDSAIDAVSKLLSGKGDNLS